jgi:histidyl-tRNA synthetase
MLKSRHFLSWNSAAMKRTISPVKGTRDFYPEQMAVRNWLYQTVRAVAESFGYQEYEAPILESLDLYAAKSGEELVKEQAYVFTDRGGEQIALRPELTPSLARMVAQQQAQLTFPLRWWSFGPFWRYERPQRGRSREFFQWNVDLLGSDAPEADAENVAVLATFFQRVGLDPSKVMILVNNRRLVDAQFDAVGIQAALRPAVSAWIDRRTKMPVDKWRSDAADLGLSESTLAGVEAMLENQDLWQQSESLRRFFSAIDAMGLRPYVRFDPSIVRGLLYYTGTVFEAWEVGGDVRRSILGGGRYDNLLADVGGSRLPAVGFAMGDVVITLLLERYGLLPADLEVYPGSILVTLFDQARLPASLSLAADLRRAGLNVTCCTEPDRLPKQFKYADRIRARIALVVGPDELAADTVTVKDLSDGIQQTVRRATVADLCRRILEPSTAR